ncbi:hypothetical protein JQ617_08025 [Bradyrhizobium sp. KB893862 SZCCT0404]|uniref:hypothetical protein n=1 Tax=Bradyrhizobium sp. KB893862 SZCCT0404 TaxID=2807672 RepID=UPI001BA4EE52|nr:hypothetical protein [Bradyrhizobium sp. KB893862 SZCCT0404]MBR1173897.1 hypothetical protein [Bradyrhizobium sp. KB893862 SZCCT0404]
MTTIRQDVADTVNDNGDDAAEAFSKLWNLDASEPSDETNNDEDDKKKKQETAQDEDDNEPEGDEENPEEVEGDDEADEDDEDEGDEDADKDPEPTVEIKDDHKFKILVDGAEQEFTLGSLKRLAGQEASLTRKSQEVATKRKTMDEQGAVLLAQQTALLDRAKKRYEPYAKLDLLAASKDPNISAEELVAVRNAAQAAYDDVQYLEQETSRVAEALRTQARKDLMEQAQESIKVLSDPEKGIEGFNQAMYGDICTFAVEQGLPAEIVNDLVNPAAIKLINMARLFMKGQKVVQTAKPDNKKPPKRIVKATATAETTKKVIKTAKAAEPMKRLKASGTQEDAADAFMARWNKPSDDE